MNINLSNDYMINDTLILRFKILFRNKFYIFQEKEEIWLISIIWCNCILFINFWFLYSYCDFCEIRDISLFTLLVWKIWHWDFCIRKLTHTLCFGCSTVIYYFYYFINNKLFETFKFFKRCWLLILCQLFRYLFPSWISNQAFF